MTHPQGKWFKFFGLSLGIGSISLAFCANPAPLGAQENGAGKTETDANASPIERVQRGNVAATLNPGPASDGLCSAEPTLTITRRGKPLFDGPVANRVNRGGDDLLGLCRVSNLDVRDLDGDQEPEILLSNYSGGAHCCLSSLIYYYDRATLSYKRLDQFWGNGGAGLEDLDQDGRPEFVSRDDRFAYAFASYAASSYPIQIWRYAKGDIKDVTRLYPQEVYGDAYELWQRYQQIKQDFELPAIDQDISANGANLGPVRAVLAAYMADKYMLNQEVDGWKRLAQLYPWRDRPQFVTSLKQHLRDTGYITGSFTQRIDFQQGSSIGSAGGRLLRGDRHRYLLKARAGQTLDVTVPQGKVRVQIFKPDGQRWTRLEPGQRKLKRALPANGDYRLEVTAPEESGYSMVVEIP